MDIRPALHEGFSDTEKYPRTNKYFILLIEYFLEAMNVASYCDKIVSLRHVPYQLFTR